MKKNLLVRSSTAEFLIFQLQSKEEGIQVRYEDKNLWMTQKSISDLFNN